MLLAAFYVLAITLIIMHYTGWLAKHNLEWLLYILALTVFPAVLYL
jgi:low affinity Fe/Cu permease